MYHMKSTCTLKLITSENKHNKLFEKLRESEEAGGGGGGGFKHTRISFTVVGLSNSSPRRGPWERG